MPAGDCDAAAASDINVHFAGDSASARGLFAARALQQGEVVLAVPVRCARIVSTTVAALRTARKGVLGPALDNVDATLARCDFLLPGDTRRVLLLALGLLAELRDPKSAGRPEVRLLPAPPGSPLAAVCRDGPPATDLQLFSNQELAELQCPPLEAVVMRERLRLAGLHALLFAGPQPAVSLQSFTWVHCLVRSRALSLRLPPDLAAAARTGGGCSSGQTSGSAGDGGSGGGTVGSVGRRGGGCGITQLDMCMMPLVDLANHRSGGNATCNVRLRVRPGGSSTVELVAARGMRPGDEVSISYGDRPLRDFLRGYAFTPDDQGYEVYEDFGSLHQALIVRSLRPAQRPMASSALGGSTSTCSSQQSLERDAGAILPQPADDQSCPGNLVLHEVRILAPGNHSLLDFDGASVCYSIGGGSQHGSHYGVSLVVQAADTAASGSGGSGSSRSCSGGPAAASRSGRGATVSNGGGGSTRSMDAKQSSERQPPAQRDDSSTLEEVADAGTDSPASWEAGDAQMMPAQLDPGVEAAVCRHIAAEAQALLSQATSIQEDEELVRQHGHEAPDATESAPTWTAWMHRRLAVQYRLARKRLLQQVVEDMQCQAHMVSAVVTPE